VTAPVAASGTTPGAATGAGLGCALGAYVAWGLFPLYFVHVARVPVFEVVVHRSLWSLVFVLGLLAALGRIGQLTAALHDARLVRTSFLSALLLAANWMVYVWAVNNARLVEASLGYFINPLVNVLLGFVFLHERLRAAQWVAVALAAAGVLWLGWQLGQPPWVALTLACSFGVYGLMRKTAALGAIDGLALETLLLAPIAAGLLAWWTLQGTGAFVQGDPTLLGWLLLAGPLTALPLLLFAAAARRLSLATLGLMQYLSPSIQLALGVWVFHEPFGADRQVGFAFIWAALVLYSAESLWTAHRRAATAPA
jgi:chloramphenicol-sensitive protein RarD